MQHIILSLVLLVGLIPHQPVEAAQFEHVGSLDAVIVLRPAVPLITPEADAVAVAVAEQPIEVPPPAPEPVYTQPVYKAVSNYGGLIGSIGYANPYGNCVNEPGVNNPGYGNPSDWPATSQTPWIGATVLFWYNHTGVITGIWSNGDIEIRHQNFQGGQHRFPRSSFRGFR